MVRVSGCFGMFRVILIFCGEAIKIGSNHADYRNQNVVRKLTLGIGLNRELPVQPDHPVIQDLHFISPRAATKQAARCSLRVTWVTDMAILCKQKNTLLEKHICTKGTKPMHWRASFAGFDLFLSNPLFGSREFDIEHFKARVIR